MKNLILLISCLMHFSANAEFEILGHFRNGTEEDVLIYPNAVEVQSIKTWATDTHNLKFADFSQTGVTAEVYSEKMLSAIESFQGFKLSEIPSRYYRLMQDFDYKGITTFEEQAFQKSERYIIFHHALAVRAGLETETDIPFTKLFNTYLQEESWGTYIRTPHRNYHPDEFEPCSFYIERKEAKTGPTSKRPKKQTREEELMSLVARELVKKGYKELDEKEFAKYVITGLAVDEVKKQEWSSSLGALHSVPYVRASLAYSSQALIDTNRDNLIVKEDFSKLRKIPFWKPLAQRSAVKAVAHHFYECKVKDDLKLGYSLNPTTKSQTKTKTKLAIY